LQPDAWSMKSQQAFAGRLMVAGCPPPGSRLSPIHGVGPSLVPLPSAGSS